MDQGCPDFKEKRDAVGRIPFFFVIQNVVSVTYILGRWVFIQILASF